MTETIPAGNRETPDGYSLPEAATALIAHARAYGWLAKAYWTPGDATSSPFVSVEVGRRLTEAEREQHRGPHWLYRLTWHSRGCPPGRLRRFGSGLAATPDSPAPHPAPSVQRIREIITAHPAPGRQQ
ncbi:hypothetical protein [Streptomyces syringium]|uniref:hypothetical protein n=1 Tax=Streptomyces syringium TaxID=76729 RepID=UPI0037D474CD